MLNKAAQGEGWFGFTAFWIERIQQQFKVKPERGLDLEAVPEKNPASELRHS